MNLPPPPSRLTSVPTKVTFKGAQSWRESLAAFSCVILLATILIALLITGVYVLKDRAVVEELFDYIDKTVAISKINYNHVLGIFKVNQTEMGILSEHQSYRTLLSCLLFSDIACLIIIIFILVLYFTTDVSTGKIRLVFWILISIGALYCIVSIHILTFLLLPYSSSLSTASQSLLDRSIPHNPGGLVQMENRFGCTFDLNIYAAYERRKNAKNSCDPYLWNAFIPRGLLLFLMSLRLLPLVIFVLLCAKRTPVSEWIAQMMERYTSHSHPTNKRLYVKKQHYRQNTGTYQAEFGKSPGGSVLKDTLHSVPLPSSSSAIDHSISYNNTAYLGTSGLNTSRSSELSRIEDIDLLKGAIHHESGSVMSEV